MAEQFGNQAVDPQDDHAEFELSHTDKLVGVFTEPENTFKSIANFKIRATDWLLPLAILIVITIISSIVIMSNPVIKQQLKEKQNEQMQKMVDEGMLTQEQIDRQSEMSEKFMSGPIFYIMTSVGIIFSLVIVFLVVTGFYFLLIKLLLKGEGGYHNILVAYGLPLYICVIQSIIMAILSIALGKMVMGINLNLLLDLDMNQLSGFLVSKVDPLSIWFYVVFGIACAKLFKSNETGKYVGVVVGVWLVTSLILFFIAQSFPMIKSFVGIG